MVFGGGNGTEVEPSLPRKSLILLFREHHLTLRDISNQAVRCYARRGRLLMMPEADAITRTWRLFGNCGVVAHRDRPVPEQFTRAAPVVPHWSWLSEMFKTLYRNDGTYGKLGIVRIPRHPGRRMANAGSTAMDARWTRVPHAANLFRLRPVERPARASQPLSTRHEAELCPEGRSRSCGPYGCGAWHGLSGRTQLVHR